MRNSNNIYFADAKNLKKELLENDILSQFTDGRLEVETTFGMTCFSFKEIAENKNDILKKIIGLNN